MAVTRSGSPGMPEIAIVAMCLHAAGTFSVSARTRGDAG